MQYMDLILTVVTVECEVSAKFFERHPIVSRVNGTFDRQEEVIKARYEEIINFLKAHDVNHDELLSYEHILILFKGYVYKVLLNEAIKYTLTDAEKYDIMENLMHMLTDEKLREYVMGKPMISAFTKAIRMLPVDNDFDTSLHGSEITLLEKKFLNKECF